MVVLILERVPPGLKGDLSRWMIEPKAGIFLGRVSTRVRDELWKKAIDKSKAGSCVQIWTTNQTEQGFSYRTHGDPTRQFVDLEGLHLVLLPPS